MSNDYYNNNQQYYDPNAAQDAGYAAGRVEEGFDRADNDVRRDEWDARQDVDDMGRDARRDFDRVADFPENVGQDVRQDADRMGDRVEQGFDNGVADVEDAPHLLDRAVKGVASWFGDKVGDVEGEGRRVEGDVDNFDQGVDQSFDQGEQQGRNQGGW